MATVTKDFKVKNGIKVQGDANIDASLYVAGPNATVNGSEIITEDIITGGTQTNIAVTYDAQSKTLNFVAENGVADSTTSDLVEGTNLYFTDARAVTAVEAAATSTNTADKIVKRDSTGGFEAGTIRSPEVSTAGNLWLGAGSRIDLQAGGEISLETYGGNIVFNATAAGSSGDVYVGSVAAGNEVATLSDIDALTTSDIEEGANLYFTNQRAIDAVGGSASSENIANTVVKRDASGNFAAQDITVNTVNFENGTGSVTTDGTGMSIFAASGDVNLGAMQGQVKIGGSQVTTTDNTQILTNKTIGDSLTFHDGSQSIPSNISSSADDLSITAGQDLTLTSQTGNLVLNPDPMGLTGKAYIGATTVGNEIATHSYVDNAVAGLAWKESVHLLYDGRSQTTPPPTGPSGVLVIDGHSALTQASDGYRILIITTGGENSGIYTYNDNGTEYTLTRSSDADAVAELVGAAVFVMEGDQFNATSWVQSNHYLTAFEDQNWTQFSGTGNYTAGFGINLVGREFSADTTEMATSEALGNAVSDLTDYVDGFLNSTDGTVIEYIDGQDTATLLAANGYSDTLVATGDATATPQYLAINVNDVAKQVAATSSAFATLPSVAYSFATTEYRSAEFLVKLAYGTHTEVSKVILTLDTSDNVAITEYAIVGTNGSMSTITAAVNTGTVELQVTPVNDSTITVVGTLLV